MATNATHYCMNPLPKAASAQAGEAYSGRRAAVVNEYRWPPGSVVRVKFLSGDRRLQKRVRDEAETWIAPELANLSFSWVPRRSAAEIRIDFQPGDGSWSYLGTEAHNIGRGKPTMNFGWIDADSPADELRRVVLHEFGHALGLIHEHQNPDRPIQWNRDAVVRDLSGPPNFWDISTIETNMFEKYDPAKLTSTATDPESIMMYPIPASWTLDGFSADLNDDLSENDRGLIHQAYP
jgi:serralysin